MLTPILGGLGLFLLGMILLTDGLKALAGEALRSILTRFVAGPVSGVAWGALLTALVQSSHATTFATIGFVSAGLLNFTQALGVIFGANLGTTSTGWIVSQLGFKVSLGLIAPPIVLAGVVLRLLAKGRWRHIGEAVAGFGMLFLGIDMLQSGMLVLAERFDPASLPGFQGAGGLTARLLLVLIGFAMTLVMQSSSASMATTLAAVASGAIGYEQAAALIIGQNIGTTPTAAAAAIGAPNPAQRAALAHILFNLITGAVAFVALPLLLRGVDFACNAVHADDAPTRLALFHTAFNILGVALLLPVISRFGALIAMILPEKEAPATRYFTEALESLGPVAIESARRALLMILRDAAAGAPTILATGRVSPPSARVLEDADRAIDQARGFVHRLARAPQGKGEVHRHESLLHAMDHLARFVEILRQPPHQTPARDPVIHEAVGTLSRAFDAIAALDIDQARAGDASRKEATARAAEASSRLAGLRKQERHAALTDAAQGGLNPRDAVARIDALLRIDSLGYHAWRACRHLALEPESETPPPNGTPHEAEIGREQASDHT